MRFRVRHLARYRYDAPVALGPHVVRLTPRAGAGMSHGIRVTPEPAFRRDEVDLHGNRITRLGFEGLTNALVIESRFELETRGVPAASGEAARAETYLKKGADAPGIAATAARLRALAGPDPEAFAESLAATLHAAIRHDPDDTAPLRAPGDTLARGRGSRRDIAGLFVELSRRAGLPARFVSGYWAESVHPASPRSLHSWPEVRLAEGGWQGFDPTLGTRAGEGHVALAAAPDLSGTVPITGSTYGAGIPVSTDFELTILTPG